MSMVKREGRHNSTGVGVKIVDMDDEQFQAHMDRVLGRMYARNASEDQIQSAITRMTDRRSSASG